ncbi:TonB-dependent receptor plug domain-containing protein [Sphingomonas sp. 1P08PE]|uniref:TonB-dependent receptor plug domain-containing protein n=1 Tax=Sphingomonas sp. 1P08PE TaxID=554122 RepID=UPI00399F37BC
MLHHRLCRSLLSGAALLAVPAAHAQTAPEPAPAAADAPAEDGATDIVVTGSRITRPDYEAPNPIVSFDAATLQRSGNTNVTEFLRRVPALTNSIDSTRSAGNAQADGALGQAGLNLLDLRGLGTNRTLVLVNGRRHVAGQFDTAAVDINSIPTDLIERVDVLTGAASAVYGADGVSGVVNFILRRNFEGLGGRAQFGVSDRGDAANRFASIIAGRNFGEGRGNVTLAYEYNAEQPLANDDRAYLRSANRVFFVNNKNYVAGQPGSYVKIPTTDNRYTASYFDANGVQQPGGSYANIIKIGDRFFRGDGQPYTFGTQSQTDDYSQGGDDTPVAGYIGDIVSRTRRHAVNLLAHYDVSDAFKLSFEGKFVQSSARTFSSYSGTYSSPTGEGYNAPIALDNPFIPASLLAAAQAEGLTSIVINRNNFDLPRRGEDVRRRTWRGVVDASGRISDHAGYDLSYTYGRTDVRSTKLNDRLADRYPQALDAVRDASGQIVCRSAAARAAGCLPVNTFGTYVADPAAFDYFLFDPVSRARVEQHVVNASLTGDFGQFFALPGGPIQFAAGGEYRRESSRFRPAPELLNGAFYQFDEPLVPTPSSGAFDVWELFGELNAPLLKDKPFAYLLSVGAAGRYSDYSTVGSTEAYQFNAIYAPVEDISFRGSYGRSVRAPNIAEVFRPRTGLSDFIEDPCYLANRGQGTQFRQANCQTLIAGLGGDPAAFSNVNNPDASVNIVGVEQGNPNLAPEVARTWTGGVVLRPRFVPRLQIAADWYDIRLKGAINRASPTDLARLCVDLESIDNPYCAAVTRRRGTGYISGYTVSPQNVAAFRTAGLEVNIAYQIPTDSIGRFDLRLVGGYLHRLELVPLPGAAETNNLDQPFRPKYNLVFSPSWTIGKLTAAYNLRWQNGTRRFSRNDTDGREEFVDPRYFRFKELWQHDVQAQLDVDERFSFYGGVNNLANQKPDIGFETNVPISPLGRYIYAGVKVRYDPR